MFDTITILGKHIPEISELESRGYVIKSLQTKDFDCLMDDYTIDESGKLFLDEVTYELKETPLKGRDCFVPLMNETSRKKKFVPYTSEIEAYDFFSGNGEKDDVSISFEILFIEGVLQHINLKELTVTPAEEVYQRRKSHEDLWNRRKNDPLYQIADFLHRKIIKVINFISKIQSILLNFMHTR